MRETTATTAEVNIHLRARAQDRMLIDQAAELVGANRSQFMMASALKEAKNILLDQSTLFADANTFQKSWTGWIPPPPPPRRRDEAYPAVQSPVAKCIMRQLPSIRLSS